jgi:hypothetical protein
MSSDRGWYLVAVGVLALGLGNSLARLDRQWAGDLVAQSVSSFQQVVTRADSYLAIASMIFAGNDQSWSRVFPTRFELASRQAQIAGYRAEKIRARAEALRIAVNAGRQPVNHCASMNNAHAFRAFVSSADSF